MDTNILHETVEEDDANVFVENLDDKHEDECENNNMKVNVQDDDGASNKVATDLFEILHVLEMLLSFPAWYKCGGPYSCGNLLETHIQFGKC